MQAQYSQRSEHSRVRRARGENELANSVARAAEPLALFFPGLVEAPSEVLQVLLDYGLAAMFWVLVAGVVGRIFN